MGGGESNALDARHVMYVVQQVCEGPGSSAGGICSHARKISSVCINILPQQGHFSVASLSQPQHLPLQAYTGLHEQSGLAHLATDDALF